MQLENFHCHVYFEASEQQRAHAVLAHIKATFGFEPGRFHTGPVGPHVGGSCQVRFSAADFGKFVPWLMEHRDGLTCFIHGLTGDDIVDHTAHVLWLGKEWELNLSGLQS
ncbi:MAG: DOPA 4,5-dioxygenase family protein [Planctomycetota bacterium]|jgi:DOPA 4,5-dioxygenase|nr:DOPA 4,5-dioxygenase family protein [Planctomycetota bacterium]